jgi:phosphoglucosamine mutase
MLESALAAGLAAMGVDVVNVGVVPTPAVAQIVLARSAAAGVVISASHNPFEDNGIKFFGANGRKLPDRVEDEIEALMGQLDTLPRPVGGEIGRIESDRHPVNQYIDRVMATLDDKGEAPLRGLRLVMDCANGAAYLVAPQIFRLLGAEVILLHAEPDGVNINVNCGSTRPQEMAAKVLEVGAHAGLAFDGDADRVMLADEHGAIVDGDRMLAIIGLHLHEQGRLPGNVVVATIMSNVGLEQALGARDIRLHRTDVGDRYVAEAMETLGAAIGGEQSGHILLPTLTPTGDGLVTALQVLTVMHETAKPLSELAGVVHSCPQLLKNVRVRTKRGWRDDPDIQRAIVAGRKRLGSDEWLSVRPSGTEPLIRVMAQGTERETVEAVVHDICAVVEQKLGRE